MYLRPHGLMGFPIRPGGLDTGFERAAVLVFLHGGAKGYFRTTVGLVHIFCAIQFPEDSRVAADDACDGR